VARGITLTAGVTLNLLWAPGPGVLPVEWCHRDGNLLRLNANLGMTPAGESPMTADRKLWLEGGYSERGVFSPEASPL